MTHDLLKIGTRLEIMRRGDQLVYITRVEDVSTQEFAIGIPFGTAGAEVLRPGDYVTCSFVAAVDQQPYEFTSMVLRREHRNIPLYFLSKPSEFVRVQRRAFVRLEVLLEAHYRLENDKTWTSALVIDISGGGLKLAHRHPIRINQVIDVQFTLGRGEARLLLRGKVVRCEPTDGSNTTYHSGIRFINLSMATQDQIIGFIFARMLEKRRTREA